ncbi:MAG: hypothetical protein EBU66_16920, partial [Bacteroidetes bacterium]|nr:hypothetical protein [Bacteroidota bacterium]
MHKFINGLCSWHAETLSAWTMILLYLVAIYKTKQIKTRAAELILLAHTVHIPFSVKYHAEYPPVIDNLKNDVIMIFVSNIIIHYALTYKLPWSIKSITLLCFMLITVLVYEEVQKEQVYTNLKFIAIRHSFVFLLHYLTFIWNKKYALMFVHV